MRPISTAGPLWSWTLTEVRDAIASGDVSALEVVESVVARIESRQHVNAYVTVAAESALAQAKSLTDARASSVGPLHGVPVSLKDNIATRDMPTTVGSPLFREWQPARDAVVVERLRGAGAIVLGKNNLFELAFGAANPAFQESRNPWRQDLSSGGSSNGSAAAVADGQAYGAVGTDTGGSVRIPAALCGVVGVKPTRDLVDIRGIVPVSLELDTAGPMARSVADAALLLGVMADAKLGEGSPDTDTKVVGIPAAQPSLKVVEPVAAAVEKAAETLREAGLEVREVDVPDLALCREVMWIIASVDIAQYHHKQLVENPELICEPVRRNLTLGATVPAVDYVRAQRIRRRLSTDMAALFREIDLLLLPSLPMLHYARGEEEISVGGITESVLQAIMRFTPLANLTGQPAVVVPVANEPGPCPLTVQLYGRHREDGRLLRTAELIETSVAAPP